PRKNNDVTEFLQERCREDKFEAAIFKKLTEDLTGRAPGANERARQDVGVKDRSKHGLPAFCLPGAMLGLVGAGVRFLLGKCRLLPGKGIEKPQPGEPLQLQELFHGDHGSQGLPLALNNELVMAERDTIQ